MLPGPSLRLRGHKRRCEWIQMVEGLQASWVVRQREPEEEHRAIVD